MEMDSTEARLHRLAVAALDGDRVAYRQLLEVLAPYLKRYFARRLAPSLAGSVDDLVQETLFAIHKKRMTYDPKRPFTAWMHAVAQHKLIDHLRLHGRAKLVPIEGFDGVAPDRDAIAAHDLDKVLAMLPERTSNLIRSVKVEGASVAEAATAHGMSENAAKVAIHRGLKSLMQRFARGAR